MSSLSIAKVFVRQYIIAQHFNLMIFLGCVEELMVLYKLNTLLTLRHSHWALGFEFPTGVRRPSYCDLIYT